MRDICDVCYVKNPKHYTLKYHEYMVPSNSTNNNSFGYKLLNTISFEFHDIDVLNNKIITGDDSGSGILQIRDNIDTDIVDSILDSLIINKNKLKKFRNICYNIMVQQSDTMIFYDYSDGWNLLTNWLQNLMRIISSDKYYLYSSHYYDNIKNYKKEIKQGIYRCVIITPHNKFTLKKMVSDFQKLGMQNIFVSWKHESKNIYDVSNFKNFLQNKKKLIMSNIDNNKLNHNDIINGSLDDIFCRPRYLLLNFLKWICVT